MILYSHGRDEGKHPQMPRHLGGYGEREPKKMLPEGSGQTALFFYRQIVRYRTKIRATGPIWPVRSTGRP